MTAPLPDHASLDSILAAYEAASAADHALLTQQAATLTAQYQTELAKDTADVATIAQLNSEVAALQAQVAALTPKSAVATFGANLGGWSNAVNGGPLETGAAAQARIIKAYGLATAKGIVRWWPNAIVSRTALPSSMTDVGNVVVEWDVDPSTVTSGGQDAQLGACAKMYKPGDWIILNHEFDNAVHKAGNSASLLASHTAAQSHAAKVIKANAPAGVRVALILMGGAFVPGRGMDGHTWVDYWPKDASGKIDPTGFDAVGADSYQHMLSTGADTAATIIAPVIAAAKQLGIGVLFGEIGCLQLTPPFTGGIGDADRAKFLTDTVNAVKQAAVDLAPKPAVALYFESNNGPGGPYCLLAKPDGTAGSPLAAGVWTGAIAG